MGCEVGQCKTSTPQDIFIVTPSLEGWPTKAKHAPSPHEVRLTQLDTNSVFFLMSWVVTNVHEVVYRSSERNTVLIKQIFSKAW